MYFSMTHFSKCHYFNLFIYVNHTAQFQIHAIQYTPLNHMNFDKVRNLLLIAYFYF